MRKRTHCHFCGKIDYGGEERLRRGLLGILAVVEEQRVKVRGELSDHSLESFDSSSGVRKEGL
jgi:hypothetical protein